MATEYIGPSYLTVDGYSFTWDGSEYVYDGSADDYFILWNDALNDQVATDTVNVTIRLDDTLSWDLSIAANKDEYGASTTTQLPSGSAAGTYSFELDCATGFFEGLNFHFGYSAYSVISITIGEDLSLFWTNFKDQEEFV